MAKKKKLISLDESIIEMGEKLVSVNVELNDFSHLVSTLIVKEYKKLKKDGK